MDYHYRCGQNTGRTDEDQVVRIISRNRTYQITLNQKTYLVSDVHLAEGILYLTVDDKQMLFPVAREGGTIFVGLAGTVFRFERSEGQKRVRGRRRRRLVEADDTSVVQANMPGTVLAVLISEGEAVEKGQPLLLLEAMKMEIRLAAPRDGVVEAVQVQVGALVQQGDILVTLV